MKTASLAPAIQSAPPALSNLFSYLQELFHEEGVSARFDTSSDAWWSLESWFTLLRTSPEGFQLQFNDPQQPILSILPPKKPELFVPQVLNQWIRVDTQGEHGPRLIALNKRTVAFSESSDRVRALAQFRAKAEGKTLSEIAHLAIPAVLNQWLSLSAPEGKLKVETLDREELFEELPERKHSFAAFQLAYQHYQRHRKSYDLHHALYEQLHTLSYELGAAGKESLSLSFGLLSGKIGGKVYHNFLFHTSLEIRKRGGELQVYLGGNGGRVSCDSSFLQTLPSSPIPPTTPSQASSQAELIAKVEEFNAEEKPFGFTIEHLEKAFHQPALEIMRSFPTVIDQFFVEGIPNFEVPSDIPTGGIRLSFSPIVQVRNAQQGNRIVTEAGQIIEKLKVLQQQGQLDQVPRFLHKLFGQERVSIPLRVAYRNRNRKKELKPPTTSPTDRRIYFPLSSTEQQHALVHKLMNEEVAVLKAEPGKEAHALMTNIAVHFAAEGKSVLVLSKQPDTGKQMKAALRGNLRHLIVAPNQTKDLTFVIPPALRALAQLIQEHPLPTASRPQDSDTLARIEQQITWNQKQLQDFKPPQQTEIELYNPYTQRTEAQNAEVWAGYRRQFTQALTILEDHLSCEQNTDDLTRDLLVFIEQAQRISADVVDLIQDADEQEWEEKWMSPEQLHQIYQGLDEIEACIDPQEYRGLLISSLDEEFERLYTKAKKNLDFLDSVQSIAKHPAFRPEKLRELFEQYDHLLKPLLSPAYDHQVDVVALGKEDPDVLMEQVIRLEQKFGDKPLLSKIQQKTLPSNLKKFFKCKVDYLPLLNLDQVKVLKNHIEGLCLQKKLYIVIKNYFDTLGMDLDREELMPAIHDLSGILRALDRLDTFNEALRKRQLPEIEYYNPNLEKRLILLSNLEFFKIHAQLSQQLGEVAEQIKELLGDNDSPMAQQCMEAIQARDLSAYRKIRTNFLSLQNQSQQVELLNTLIERIGALLPRTAEKFSGMWRNNRFNARKTMAQWTREIELDIFHLKLRDYFQSFEGQQEQSHQLLEEIQQLTTQREELLQVLAEEKTLFHTTERLHEDLVDTFTTWMDGKAELSQLATPYGKKQLQELAQIFPIWVTSSELAMDLYASPEPAQIDVLILEEAQLHDLKTLPLIFRAQKCLVIGSDNIEPHSRASNGIPNHLSNQLLMKYLANHPLRQLFDVNNPASNIYTLGTMIDREGMVLAKA